MTTKDARASKRGSSSTYQPTYSRDGMAPDSIVGPRAESGLPSDYSNGKQQACKYLNLAGVGDLLVYVAASLIPELTSRRLETVTKGFPAAL